MIAAQTLKLRFVKKVLKRVGFHLRRRFSKVTVL